eukprot:570081-Rhodomonas_salina.2
MGCSARSLDYIKHLLDYIAAYIKPLLPTISQRVSQTPIQHDLSEPVFLFQSEFQPGHLKDEEKKFEDAEGEKADGEKTPEVEGGAERKDGAKEEEEKEEKETQEKKERGGGGKKKEEGKDELGGLVNGDELEFNVVESRQVPPEPRSILGRSPKTKTRIRNADVEMGGGGWQDGKLTAIRVVKLAAGTVSFEEMLEGRFEGLVDKPVPCGVSTLSKKVRRVWGVVGSSWGGC